MSSVCTWFALLGDRQRKQPEEPFDGDEHHYTADTPNLTAGLLRGKLVPRGDKFWRCCGAPNGSDTVEKGLMEMASCSRMSSALDSYVEDLSYTAWRRYCLRL